VIPVTDSISCLILNLVPISFQSRSKKTIISGAKSSYNVHPLVNHLLSLNVKLGSGPTLDKYT
jgi:hypothetical protein